MLWATPSRHRRRSTRRAPEPSERPDFALAHGMQRLPPELRLMILEYAMSQSEPVDEPKNWPYWQVGRGKVSRGLGFVEALIVKFGAEAAEAFYKNNTIKIDLFSERYPPRPINNFIRRLQITMEYFEVPEWTLLGKLCTGSLGFEKLEEIDIHLHLEHREDDDVYFTLHSLCPVIVAKVKKLSVTYHEDTSYLIQDGRTLDEGDVRSLEDTSLAWTLWEKITLCTSEDDDVHEIYEHQPITSFTIVGTPLVERFDRTRHQWR